MQDNNLVPPPGNWKKAKVAEVVYSCLKSGEISSHNMVEMI